MPTNKLCCLLSCPNNSRRTRRMDARYFSIPSDQNYAKRWIAWIQAENHPVSKDLRAPHLCSQHFSSSCILPNGKLAAGSVPSIGKRNLMEKSDVPDKNTNDKNFTLSDLLRNCEPVTHYRSYFAPMSCHPCKNSYASKETSFGTGSDRITGIHNAATNDSAGMLLHSSLIDRVVQTAIQRECTSRNMNGAPESTHATHSLKQTSDAAQITTLKHSDKRQPKRYFGDLSLSDFTTPGRAKKSLDLAKRVVQACRKKVKIEQMKKRRLMEKVKTLESLVQRVKNEKKLASKKAAIKIQTA